MRAALFMNTKYQTKNMTQPKWKYGGIDLMPNLKLQGEACSIRGNRKSGLIIVEGTGDSKLIFPAYEDILADCIEKIGDTGT